MNIINNIIIINMFNINLTLEDIADHHIGFTPGKLDIKTKIACKGFM